MPKKFKKVFYIFFVLSVNTNIIENKKLNI